VEGQRNPDRRHHFPLQTMRNPAILIVLGTVGLGLGVLGGRYVVKSRFSGAESASTLDRPSPAERPTLVPTQTVGKADKARNLAALLRFVEQPRAGILELKRELERMDIAGLQGLITDLQNTPMVQDDDASPLAGQTLRRLAISELFRREGERSLEWAAGLADATIRRSVLGQFVGLAAHDTPELAKPWIDRFCEQYGENRALWFASPVIIGATGRGAEDLVRVWELFKGDFGSYAFPQGDFPEGFDFRRLITALPNAPGNPRAIAYWAALDRDAAWAGVKELIDTQGIGASFFSSLFVGVTAVEGNREAAKWIVGKLDALPEASRESAIRSLVQQPESRQAETVQILMAELTKESDRVTLASQMVSPFLNVAEGTVALEALGSQAARVAAVTVVAKTYRRTAQDTTDPNSARVRNFLEATMQQFQFTPAAREQVAAVLASPL
jgi:hypothetical protein